MKTVISRFLMAALRRFHRARFLVAVLGALSAYSVCAAEPLTVIHAGHVLAVPGEAPLEHQTIVTEGHKIVSIEAGFIPPEKFGSDIRFIDLSNKFVLPGLMDMHMHISGIHYMDLTLQEVTMSDADIALYAARHMRRMLEAGYTTIRDVGDSRGTSFTLKNAINKGIVPGPRIFAAGDIVTRTGGHGTETMLTDQFASAEHKPLSCDGVESCRRAVRAQIARGADLIKITASGSARDEWSSPDAVPTLFPDELETIMATAKRLNRPVAVHAHSTQSINAALRAGARTIEHGTFFDDESVKLFKKTGAYLVPTSYVAEFGLKMMQNFKDKIAPDDWKRLEVTTRKMYTTAGRAYKAGIKIAAGTDLGITKTVDNVRELEIYVENGIPENEAIKTATVNPADILGMADRLGKIQPGYLADIIATEKSPLKDIKSLRAIDFVMKDGVVYKMNDKWVAD